MPSSPKVVNLRPGEGGLFSPEDGIHVGVRDEDTVIDRSSVNCIATFSKTSYSAEALPSGNSNYFDAFDDASVAARPPSDASYYLSTGIPYDSDGDGFDDSAYGPVLTIEKDSAGAERGILFLEADIDGTTPVGAEFQLGLQAYTTAAASYFPDADFTGVLGGFVYWPQNTGVFVFFKDDGATKSIEVTGPAQDGIGTRLVTTSTNFDWAASLHAPPSIRVVWDPTPRLSKVFVFLTTEDDGLFTETLLFETSIASLGKFQSGIRFGKHFEDDPPAKICAFAGINSGSPGDLVEVHNITLEEYGIFLVGAGVETPNSNVQVSTSDRTTVASYADTNNWDRSEIDAVASSSESFSFEKEAVPGNKALYLQEPELLSQQFLAVFQGSVKSTSHEGSFTSGAGFDIDDGSSLTAIRFLDDFSDTRIGVLSGASSPLPDRRVTSSYDSVESNWSRTVPEILVLADVTQAFCCVNISESGPVSPDFAAIDVGYSAADSYYNEARVGLGFLDGVDTGTSFGGNFSLEKFILLPNFSMFMPLKARQEATFLGIPALPDEAGGSWTQWSAAGTGVSTEVISESTPYWKIVPTSHTEYDFYYRTLGPTSYAPTESGVTLVARLKVDEVIDRFGVSDSVRIPTCTLLAIDVGGGKFIQLRGLISETGAKYLFLSNDDNDYLEVLRQSLTGISWSTEIDFYEMHTYMLSCRPGDGVSLYVDFSDRPAIHIPWEVASSVFLSSTHLTSSTTSVAVGAIPVSSSLETAKLTLGLVGVSVGSGFNFTAGLSVSDATLEGKIYGASANVFVDVSDND